MRINSNVFGFGAAILLASLVGCEDAQQPAKPAASAPAEATLPAEPQSEIEAALARLSDEDRQLVVAQKDCPVSDQPLGSMGPPIKITADGRSFFVCCEGCEDDARENFDKYYAEIEDDRKDAVLN